MDSRKLAENFCGMQISDASELNKIAQILQIRGEDGILLWLAKQEKGAFAIDIIKHFDLTPGRVANIMKKLETKKYVTRKTDGEDQRKAAISLTAAGRKHAARVEEEEITAIQAVLEQVGTKDADAFVEVLQKVVGLMREGKVEL